MINLLVDTNIFVYSVEKNAVFHKQATKILSDTKYIYILLQNALSEFVAVCTKLEISYSKIMGYLKEIEDNVVILFPDEDSFSIFKTLIEKYKPKGNRIFDVEHVSVAVANKINCIATFNTKDFKHIIEIKLLDL